MCRWTAGPASCGWIDFELLGGTATLENRVLGGCAVSSSRSFIFPLLLLLACHACSASPCRLRLVSLPAQFPSRARMCKFVSSPSCQPLWQGCPQTRIPMIRRQGTKKRPVPSLVLSSGFMHGCSNFLQRSFLLLKLGLAKAHRTTSLPLSAVQPWRELLLHAWQLELLAKPFSLLAAQPGMLKPGQHISQPQCNTGLATTSSAYYLI